MKAAHASSRTSRVPTATLRGSFRAIVLNNGMLRLKEESLRVPSGPAAVVRIAATGVCSADLKEIRGERSWRSDFGHELVGTVSHVSGDTSLHIGDRVCLNPNVQVARTSGFAEYVVVNAPGERLSEALPVFASNQPAAAIVWTEPLAVAVHCLARLECLLRARESTTRDVTVIGSGLFARLIALTMRHSGAHVSLCTSSSHRLERMRRDPALVGITIIKTRESEAGSADAVVLAGENVDGATFQMALATVRRQGVVLFFARPTPEVDGILGCSAGRLREQELSVETSGLQGTQIAGSYGATFGDFTTAAALHPELAPLLALMTDGVVPLTAACDALTSLAAARPYGKTVVTTPYTRVFDAESSADNSP